MEQELQQITEQYVEWQRQKHRFRLKVHLDRDVLFLWVNFQLKTSDR